MKLIVLIGRILFSFIFLRSGFNHFSGESIAYATSQNVPYPSLLVPISGILAIVGAISIILGYKARIGAWLLVLFLIPVTIMMHNFWVLSDPMMKQIQMAMFLKNVSMLGGALLITYFGAGPYSMDGRRKAKLIS
ncbi:MAG TPA: DoxX family protein [Chitinophagaceae bacterium]|nr:DoxX family protein [Chitinophagaceae bacterium]